MMTSIQSLDIGDNSKSFRSIPERQVVLEGFAFTRFTWKKIKIKRTVPKQVQ